MRAPAAAPRRKERWWLHGLLFGVTFLTTTYAGVVFAAGFRPALLLRLDEAPSLLDPRLFKEGLVVLASPPRASSSRTSSATT